MPKETKKTEQLPCLLSDAEISDKSLDATRKRYRAKRLREEASSLDQEAKRLEAEVGEGVEVRDVQCVERVDLERETVGVVRLDDASCWPDGTDIVSQRDLTDEDCEAAQKSGKKGKSRKSTG